MKQASVTLRLAFFGSDCLFSETVLQTLLHSPHKVAAVILPAAGCRVGTPTGRSRRCCPRAPRCWNMIRMPLPVISPFVQHSILQYRLGEGDSVVCRPRPGAHGDSGDAEAWCAPTSPASPVFRGAYRRSLLHVPRRGFLNVHPSLLPEYRGPSPLFWQLHAGETSHWRVSVHWMDAEFDTGPLPTSAWCRWLMALPKRMPRGLMARVSARLLVEVLDHVAAGEIPYRKQPAGGAVSALSA